MEKDRRGIGDFPGFECLHPCPRQEMANPVPRGLLLLQKGPPGPSESLQGRQLLDTLPELSWHSPGEKQAFTELPCCRWVASAFGAKCL